MKIFCLDIHNINLHKIQKLNYTPVGLGKDNFDQGWLRDNSGDNISEKNPFYGEYTFHYWLWKNYLKEIKTPWVGFCQYRKFFARENFLNFNDSFKKLQESVFTEINEKEVNFDCILGEKFSVENYKISKILKHHLLYFLKNPQAIINKKKKKS